MLYILKKEEEDRMSLKARIKKNCSEKEFKRISQKYGKAIESIDEIRKIISSSKVNLSKLSLHAHR